MQKLLCLLQIFCFYAVQVQLQFFIRVQPFCKPEKFVHHTFMENSNNTELVKNKWERARFGESVGLQQMCLLPNGLPLMRRCLLSSRTYNSGWESTSTPKFTNITCLHKTGMHMRTKLLSALKEELNTAKILSFENRSDVIKNLDDILNESNFNLLPVDVFLISEILDKLFEEGSDYDLAADVLTIANKMVSNSQVALRKSAELNATNALLDTLETSMNGLTEAAVSDERCSYSLNSNVKPKNVVSSDKVNIIDESRNGFEAHISSNISIFFINPRCTNITGLALYDENEENKNDSRLFTAKYSDFLYRYIYMNETVEDLMNEHENGLQLATFVPESLWLHIEKTFKGDKRPVIVLKVFSNDSLFVEPRRERSRKPFSKVLSISIPGYDAPLIKPLPILLRNQYKSTELLELNRRGAGCSYWNYHTWININGVETVSNTTDLLNRKLILCKTIYLKQFSYLLGGNFTQDDFSENILKIPYYAYALDIIWVGGSSLSLLGLLCIWLTAALFESWRSLLSTKLLLHMCVVLTLRMIAFIVLNTSDIAERMADEEQYFKCAILGATLQYSILVLFSWMLIVAMLQFQRYVTVVGFKRPHHCILKSAFVAWGLPLVPTLLVACIDPTSYLPSSNKWGTDAGICYPSGNGLMYGVMLPITLIIFSNCIIFCFIFYTVRKTMKGQERKTMVKEIHLSVFLFFLLGITWASGLIALLRPGTFFTYLFCFTASLQGFVLFIYFIVLDNKVRADWLQLLSRVICRTPANAGSPLTTSVGNPSVILHAHV